MEISGSTSASGMEVSDDFSRLAGGNKGYTETVDGHRQALHVAPCQDHSNLVGMREANGRKATSSILEAAGKGHRLITPGWIV